MPPSREGGRRDARWHETKKPKKGKEKTPQPSTVLAHVPEPQVIPKGKAAKKQEEL